MIGSTFSHYRIVSQIGAGGMGVVYKAEDTRLQRFVALKFLQPESISPGAKERFLREARIAAQVHHPHLCPIYEVNESEGRLFFAMALLEGESLADLIAKGPLSISQTLDIALQIASGLDTAHHHGIVHRDIKTTNIIVAPAGHTYLLDFGLALRLGADRITHPGGLVGTPAYMSPEQLGAGEVDHRSDIWAFGVVLYEMLTGRLPFTPWPPELRLREIAGAAPVSIRAIRPEVPTDLELAVLRCLAKTPAERWQSVAELGQQLRRIRGSSPDSLGLETAPGVTIDLVQPSPPVPRRSRVKSLTAAGLVALSLAAAGIWTYRSPGLPTEKQIAVLPLDVIGSDPDTRVLADGLVETLTSHLTQLEDLSGRITVVPSSEVRARRITSAEDARRLYGATLVLTGSAQRWNDRTLFTLNLVDAQKLRQIASRSFEFTGANSLALRDSMIGDAVLLLQLNLPRPAASAGSAVAYTQYLKGRGYLARYDIDGNINRAVSSLQAAVDQDRNNPLFHIAMAEAYWQKAKTDNDSDAGQNALASVNRAIALAPEVAGAYVKRGELYAEAGRIQDAVNDEQHALKLAPGNAEAYRVLADIYSQAGRHAEAEAAYRQYTQGRPTDWSRHLLQGYFYMRRGRFPEARKSLETARSLTPDNEIVYRNLAALSMRQGAFKEASEFIRRALSHDRSASIYSTLGVAYYYQRRYDEAARSLETSIDLDNTIAYAWGNLGTVYRHVPGASAQAQTAFRKAVELTEMTLRVRPMDYNSHANLAEYWAKLGRRQEALQEIEKIPAPARSPYADRIVLAYELSGDRRKAIELVKTLEPTDASLSYIRNDPDLESFWKDPSVSPLL